MDLVLQALRLKIIFIIVLAVVVLVAVALDSGLAEGILTVATLPITAGILFAFRYGLRRRLAWIAVLFALWCLFDFFGAISGGFALVNLANLLDAILSFVALCGIFIWFRNEREAKPA